MQQKNQNLEQRKTKQLYKFSFFFIGSLSILFIYQNYRYDQILTSGVYSIGRILNIEGGKGGTLIKIGYHIKGEIVIATIKNDYYKVRLNELYFIKVLPDKTNQIVFFEDKHVPNCLLNEVVPYDGWKEIPKCPD